MTAVFDLSHPIRDGMRVYPGVPVPRFGVLRTHADVGANAAGTSFHIGTYARGGNTGTYVDAPFHRFPTGADLASVPLERLVNIPGVIIDAPADGPIAPDTVNTRACRDRALLFRTGWAKRWDAEGLLPLGALSDRSVVPSARRSSGRPGGHRLRQHRLRQRR